MRMSKYERDEMHMNAPCECGASEQVILDAVPVRYFWMDPRTGFRWIEVLLNGRKCVDLPQTVEHFGVHFMKVPGNGDGVAYYREQTSPVGAGE